MARYGKVFVMVGLVLTNIALIISPEFSYAYDNEYISPVLAEHRVDDTDFLPIVPPEPYPGYYKFLRECTKHMTPPCAKEIFAGMFRDKPLTRKCCRTLVHMGYDCHNGLVKFLLLNPRLQENASKAYPKSLQIWKECVSTVDVDSPAPAY